MAEAFAAFAPHAAATSTPIVGIGGGGGTSIVTAGMRALPFGVPKLMVSTLASGDVGPYVGVSDITMMHAVADIAGLNRITRTVLAQAAARHRRHGRASAPATDDQARASGSPCSASPPPASPASPSSSRADYDCLVFHATGTGGRALEMLADSGMLAGVIDATTTEVCDELVGGVLTAGPDRLGAIARTRRALRRLAAARSTW